MQHKEQQNIKFYFYKKKNFFSLSDRQLNFEIRALSIKSGNLKLNEKQIIGIVSLTPHNVASVLKIKHSTILMPKQNTVPKMKFDSSKRSFRMSSHVSSIESVKILFLIKCSPPLTDAL